MNPKIDTYLAAGCGRCPLGNTPDCKVHNWTAELSYLREIVLDCGLTEELKWGVPCYTDGGKNLMIVSAFNEYASLSFFKGSLLRDPDGILVTPGENSQAARLLKFTSVEQIAAIEPAIRNLIREAIEVERAGLKVQFKSIDQHDVPAELTQKFEEDPAFEAAFNALTPGRRRGYLIHFAQPKQSETRISRIEKCSPQIFNGIGLHDKYKSMNRNA
ncbi:MAG: YdeI/OmpD-associated family protein [Blastocatellia bacterium]|nr:YdeI/OmpD-associated family protein [Blastocatellia bacterium]